MLLHVLFPDAVSQENESWTLLNWGNNDILSLSWKYISIQAVATVNMTANKQPHNEKQTINAFHEHSEYKVTLDSVTHQKCLRFCSNFALVFCRAQIRTAQL